MIHSHVLRVGRSSHRLLTAAAAALVALAPALARADGYLNCETTEPDADADADTLFCDDFETEGLAGGNWYGEDCDAANSNGGIVERTKGWCGNIYSNPITPAGASTCDGAGVGEAGCVGDHGAADGSKGGVNLADHDFIDQTTVSEIYVRYYQKWLDGYVFGAEKVLTFNERAGSGGIKWGNLHINCGGSPSPSGTLQWQAVGGGFETCLSIAPIESGRWYAIQVHAVLSTTSSSADGLLEAWVDDCGPSGTECPATPTQRLTQADMSWNRESEAEGFGSLWWENWANPGSTGTSYIDQIVVSRTGPIGFAGDPTGSGGGSSSSGEGGASSGEGGASSGDGGAGEVGATSASGSMAATGAATGAGPGVTSGGPSSSSTAGGGGADGASSEDDDGCGCRLAGADTHGGAAALAGLGLALAAVRRRRISRRSP